jgi:pyruvate formate lyase activating enzyme
MFKEIHSEIHHEVTRESSFSRNTTEGVVFDIQRFSVNDGHGIRTVVFLKGCPLNCPWCANPESQDKNPQIGFYRENCSFCRVCTSVCPNGTSFSELGILDWDHCERCLACAEVCLYGARTSIGKSMTVAEVLETVERDRVFYDNSGGGVTLSGGEALYQPIFTESILKECKRRGIHTALETCGFATSCVFLRTVEHVDLLLFDLKHMDSDVHRQFTGVPNEVILRNAVAGAQMASEMIVRFPLIPGFNDSEENIQNMGTFIMESLPSVQRIDVLPYHSMGESKMEAIGGTYLFESAGEVPEQVITASREILESCGLTVSIGG